MSGAQTMECSPERSSEETQLSDLKVDRSLLDPKFEGYKLTLSSFGVQKLDLGQNLRTVLPSDNQWSYQHLRLFGSHNCLHFDQWNIEAALCYAVLADGSVTCLSVDRSSTKIVSAVVHKLPSAVTECEDAYNVTVAFPSATLAAMSDGRGCLWLLNTGHRTMRSSWRQEFEYLSPMKEGGPFVIADSVAKQHESTTVVEVLLVRIEENKTEDVEIGAAVKDNRLFLTIVKWLTLKSDSGGSSWTLARQRTLVLDRGILEYCALSPTLDNVCAASTVNLRFTEDSRVPIVTAVGIGAQEDVEMVSEYKWSQDNREVSAMFDLGEHSVEKQDDVQLQIADGRIVFKVSGYKTLLSGFLYSAVESECCTFSIEEGHTIKLSLGKKIEGETWPQIVRGDDRGEYAGDAMTVGGDDATEGEKSGSGFESGQAFSGQQLEECDSFQEETSCLAYYDGTSHSLLREADIGGHQWLFNVRLDPHLCPFICLRYDVDGILWRVKPDPAEQQCWSHYATFNAYGYVQAGKPDRKFCTCATDLSYSVVADCQRHAYIYWQGTPLETVLRNRKREQTKEKVAKQNLIALDTNENILGVAAYSNWLYILTETEFYAVIFV